MQHAPSHQHKEKSVCPMISILFHGTKSEDTLILSLGQWSKIDSNQFCSTVPGTKSERNFVPGQKTAFFYRVAT